MGSLRSLLAIVVSVTALAGLPAVARTEEYRGQRGYMFLARGANPVATQWFRTEHEAYPEMAGPLAGMALAECRMGRDAEAREHLDGARALDPDDPLVLAAAACRTSVDGHFGETEELLEHARSASSIPFHSRDHARFLLHQGRFEQAEEALLEMVALGWSDGSVRSMLATTQLVLGRPEESLSVILEIRERFPRAHTAVYVLVLNELAGGPPDPSASSLPRMVTWTTGNEVVVARAEGLRRVGRLDEAELQAGRRKVDPHDPFCWSVLARLAVDLGDLAEAESRIQTARQRWPLHPSVLLTEAYITAASGDGRAAELSLADARTWGIPAWDSSFEGEVEQLIDRLNAPW